MVVCGAAEFTVGALGQRQGEALLLLELSVEAAQPGAAGGRDQGGVKEPVTVKHGGGVAVAEGAFYLVNQVGEARVDRRVPVLGEGVGRGQLHGGAGRVDVGDIRPGDVRDDDAAVHLVADQALAFEGPRGLAEGTAGDAEFGGDGGFAQRHARQQPAGQDGLPDGFGGLLGGALPLNARTQAGDRARHGHQSPSGTSRPAPCSPASRAARAATAAS